MVGLAAALELAQQRGKVQLEVIPGRRELGHALEAPVGGRSRRPWRLVAAVQLRIIRHYGTSQKSISALTVASISVPSRIAIFRSCGRITLKTSGLGIT